MRGLRQKLVLALAAGLMLGVVGGAEAGMEDAGTTAANFLSLGSGARTLAMGGATLGLGEDVGSSAWNAAALGWMGAPQAALSHAGQASGSKQEWGAYGGRVRQSQTRWAVSGIYQGEGAIEGRDVNGVSTGNLSVSSVALGATLAQQVGERLTLGVGSKYVHEKLGSVGGGGFTFDLGLMLRQGPWGLGVAAQNLLGQMKYGPAVYQFPTNYGVGLAYTHPTLGLKVALDANVPSAYHPDVRAGVEWTYRGVAAFRTGYRKELGAEAAGDPLSGASFGLGAGHNGMWMDYGYLLSGDGSGEHRVGLRFQLGPQGAPSVAREPMGSKRSHDDFESARDNTLIGPPVPGSKKR